jgi:lysyl-tRNA synthetase class 2
MSNADMSPAQHPGPASQDQPTEAQASDENHVIAERREKLAALRRTGNPFPNDHVPQDRAAELIAAAEGQDRDALAAKPIAVSMAGRMVLKRVQGKASFATLQDATGRLQIWINDEGVGAEVHEAFKCCSGP